MEHEVIVEGFVLQVEVTHCVNEPARPGTWDSDWDAMGTRELEFRIKSAVTYDDEGRRMSVDPRALPFIPLQLGRQIETALWVEIDAMTRRRRWAA